MKNTKTSKIIQKEGQYCKNLLNIIYNERNLDPLCNDEIQLTLNDINVLADNALSNEISKKLCGNGKGIQTIKCNKDAFASVPVITNNNDDVFIVNTQQQNVGNGFVPNNPSTWISRHLSDHIRRGKSTKNIEFDDIFYTKYTDNCQKILADPMRINVNPDWSPDGKNFLNGQQIDCVYNDINVWITKGYWNGSMITPLSDPRQITIIFQTGNGVIQVPHGILSFIPGDLVQIPPNTPFAVYVKKGYTCKATIIYSKEDLIFPSKQLNVSDLNQAPFTPDKVKQCEFPFNEYSKVKFRGEYVRTEQHNNTYEIYYFPDSKTAFDWESWVHQGPILHKVNLMNDFERIGTNFSHKDPTIWLILQHSIDKSFGIAFVSQESIVQINDIHKITYEPPYFHLNGVCEKAELITFSNTLNAKLVSKRLGEGQSIVFPAGIGHGTYILIFGGYIIKAILAYILNNISTTPFNINIKNIDKFNQLTSDTKNTRIKSFIKYMYTSQFITFNKNDSIKSCIQNHLNKAMDIICDLTNNDFMKQEYYMKLNIPSGSGILLIESRNPPIIPKCNKDSQFRHVKPISYQKYGKPIYKRITEANNYLKEITRFPSKL